MKEYVIHCNEEQLQLLRTAVELQMRIRIGQGWAITENLIEITDPEYRPMKDDYDDILDAILRKIVIAPDGRLKHQQKWIERDMWVGIENAIGMRKGEIGLSEYGLMKVDEVIE